MNKLIENIVKPKNDLERRIISDPDFIEGALYGKPRHGHPEGQVIYHIKEVLANIEEYYGEDSDYDELRIIALVHDTFKHKVDRNMPKAGENHHGMIARRFAEKFQMHVDVYTVIEMHDDAYNAWSKGNRRGDWYGAEKKATNSINGLLIENCLDLFIKFYYCDNHTGNKSNDDYEWFINLIQ